MTNTDIPDVGDTDLTRQELEEVAAECGIDPEGLDDQELFERLGVALGEIDDTEVPDDTADDDRDDDGASGSGLRGKVAAALQGAADRLRPADEDPSEEAGTEDAGAAEDSEEAQSAEDEAHEDEADEDEGGDDASEQALPGEPIEGPTRDEIRDELRELGLPVTGTKDELQERLDQARREQEDDSQAEEDADGAASDGDGNGGEDTQADGERLRDRAAERLHDVADWLRETGRDEGDGSGPSRLKRVGVAVKRRLPFVGGRGTP